MCDAYRTKGAEARVIIVRDGPVYAKIVSLAYVHTIVSSSEKKSRRTYPERTPFIPINIFVVFVSGLLRSSRDGSGHIHGHIEKRFTGFRRWCSRRRRRGRGGGRGGRWGRGHRILHLLRFSLFVRRRIIISHANTHESPCRILTIE